MNISIFLSYPKPFLQVQQSFIDAISTYLESRGMTPRTLGVTDYNMAAPLEGIRKIMQQCSGLLTIAFRRSFVNNGFSNPDSDIGIKSYDIDGKWLTSPYCHIEPAMAFQINLPILVLRENGVLDDGILQKGVTGTYLPEFDLSDPAKNYLETKEWIQLIQQWEGLVRDYESSKLK